MKKNIYCIFTLIFLSFELSCQIKNSENSSSLSVGPKPWNCSQTQRYKWSRNQFPFQLIISNLFQNELQVTRDENGHNTFQRSMQMWNSSVNDLGINFFNSELSWGINKTTLSDDSSLSINKISQYWPYGLDALAVFSYEFTAKKNERDLYYELKNGAIFFNYADYGSQFTWSQEPEKYDIQTVLNHELGHFLGLCHSPNQDSFMFQSYTAVNHSLTERDLVTIRNYYTENLIVPKIQNLKQNFENQETEKTLRGVISLTAKGECQHYINGDFIYSHHIKIK